MMVTGTLINLYHVCKRELWLHANGVRMEHTSDVVTEGKLVHEVSYPQRTAKYEEVRIGGSVIDYYDSKAKVIHEIKKSASKEEAYVWQVKFYIYLFEREGIEGVVGILEYPLLRETQQVVLEDADRKILDRMIMEIEAIVEDEACPEGLSKRKCGQCSYFEFCYSGESEEE
ncbi:MULTISPECIES: CRISPR-associated protein Cas4 [Butyricimonas]|uniref:CRISPR-associated protein Cas4 n=1 Tax=Butyricimonas TaxID=574697 RepID=UPI0007FB4EE2|nr:MULTISPECIES: CRISPR-associated protein Cas4 [Butyricimonas]